MISRIEQDHSRFREIIRGKIRQNLRKYISRGDLIAPKGQGSVSIPMPQINIPRFVFGDNSGQGVGQGEGDPGDPIGGQQKDGQSGSGKAGEGEGNKALEVEVSLEELAEIMGEELGLPNIQRRGTQSLETKKDRYVGLRNTGPESLRSFKATFKRALRRQVAMGTYNPARPIIVPIRDDRRYRSWRTDPRPQSNAVIIYMMDVSGSMGDEQKEIVRIESFWIDTWLRSQYKGLESRYIIHDATARVVEREVFFKTRESGGTMISSAYKVCSDLIDAEFNPASCGTSTRSTSPTATTGRSTTRRRASGCSKTSCCRGSTSSATARSSRRTARASLLRTCGRRSPSTRCWSRRRSRTRTTSWTRSASS
jgi:uncharacterized sporulation protein YeaH/YhbH (DUF444 family)